MSARLPEPLTAAALMERFGGRLARGDASRRVERLASLSQAAPGDLSFLTSAPFKVQAETTEAGVVLVGEVLLDSVPTASTAIVVDDPYATYARVAAWIDADQALRRRPPPGVDPSARVAADATVGPGAAIGPCAVIEAGATIAAGAVIGPGCVVGAGASIGERTCLVMQVTVYPGCTIGADGLFHASAVIGSDGFGFAPERGSWVKIPQLGTVVIGDRVEVGSNTSIDRGALDPTVIGDGCKIDNLVQIGHNVRLGDDTVVAGCVGISGSAVIGKRCRLGGGVGIVGHITICDDVTLTGMTMVTRSIGEPGVYSSGFPIMEHAAWERSAATLRHLPELRKRLRKLEQQIGTPR